ncbi:transposase [Variovorax sp. KK3]|uniref:IS66-like element accessory protein TnpA n=1 Tax=Variovorax sp. KK3 TaxID=1855728 RepID=UPI00097BFEE8
MPATRRRHSEELKHELIERSLEPGASVAAIAQENGINANLLFNWRRIRLHAEGPATEAAAPPMLLPVKVQMDAVSKAVPKAIAPRPSSGVIEIDVGPRVFACAEPSTRPACTACCACSVPSQ